MELPATFAFAYTEEMFGAYYRARERRGMRALGGGAAAVGVAGAIFSSTCMTYGAGGAGLALAGLFAVVAVAGALCATAGPRFMRVPSDEAREFFARHGADVAAAHPWEFAETVTVGLNGVIIECAAALGGGTPLALHKSWGEWGRVVETPEYLMFVSRGDGSSPLLSLFGYEFLFRRRKRNLYEDAVLPKRLMDAVDAAQLAEFARSRIEGAARPTRSMRG